MNLSTLNNRGFVGQDINLNIALSEYGLCWKLFNRSTKNTVKGEYLFWYGVVSESDGWTQFDYAYLQPNHFTSDFGWCDFNGVATCCGMSVNEWMESPFENRICDLCNYYGFIEVFGESYNSQKIGGLSFE